MTDNRRKFNRRDYSLRDLINDIDDNINLLLLRIEKRHRFIGYFTENDMSSLSEAEINQLFPEIGNVTLERARYYLKFSENRLELYQRHREKIEEIQNDKDMYEKHHSLFCKNRYWSITEPNEKCTNCNKLHSMRNDNNTTFFVSCSECCKQHYGLGGVNSSEPTLPVIEMTLDTYMDYLYQVYNYHF
jgi:hypothetical protein